MIACRQIRPLPLCIIILVLVPHSLSPNQSQIRGSDDDLIRWSFISAEHFLQDMDHPLSGYINHWLSINRVLPLLTDQNLIAKAKLLKLELLSRSLTSWAKWSRVPEYTDWLKSNIDSIYFNNSEDRGWFLRTAEYWGLFEDSKGLDIADMIAWEAVNNPEPRVCESDLACYFQLLDRTFIKYLQLFPDGHYTSLALEEIGAFCLTIKNSALFRARLEELFGNASSNRGSIINKDASIIRHIIGKIAERLAYYGPSISSTISRQANELFAKHLNIYLDKQNMPYDSFPNMQRDKKPEDAEADIRIELWSLRYHIDYLYNLELPDLIDIWNKLEGIARGGTARDLRAQSELLKIKCMKRIANLAATNPNPSSTISAWIAKYGQYFHSGKLRSDFVWKSFEIYRDLSISDDLAWEAIYNASVNPDSEDEGSEYIFSNQLNDILMTFGRYLQLKLDGKYSNIAIESIREFLNSCLKQNDLRLPPFGLDAISKSEYLQFQATLKRILSNSNNTRAIKTIAALATIERVLINRAP